MALPEDHLAKFHEMADAKEMWEAIKSRFGGNDESKKIHKYLLKQQFEVFSVSTSEGLHKGYDRFQTLSSQLEIHDAGVSHEDANQKFLRSLPSFGSQVALIMRTKPGLDTLSFDDLYNNLRVFERDVKGTTISSSNTQNVAFVSADNASITNDVSTAYSISSSSVSKSQKEGSSSYTDEINDDDMEEMDSKWQNTSIAIKWGILLETAKLKGIKTAEAEKLGIMETKLEIMEDAQNYDMMAYSSSNSGSDNESVFINKESDLEDAYVNDRNADGMHATSIDESDSKPSEYAFCETDSSVDTTTSMPALVENASKVVCEPKVWTNALIIEEENVKESGTPNHSPKIWKHGRTGHTRKGLGYAFTRKACFFYCSFIHIIRYCDFPEKRIAKQAELAKSRTKVTGERDNRSVGNNVQRVNHQNKFVPSVLLTKTGKFPVNAARQIYFSQAASTSTASKVNTARPFVNESRPKSYFYKNLSPNKRPFHNITAQRTTFSYHKVNTVNTSLSAVNENRDTDVKASAEFKGGPVAFGGSNGRITGKGKIKVGKLDFEDVYFVEELKHYNLFSVSQMYDKKNKVKTIRSDNGIEFKNNDLIEFYGFKGIKREYSNARTSQQNGVAERKNRTLIETARTMLVDSFLPITFWAETVNTACYVFNRILVTKRKKKTPYELLTGKQPIISCLRPFGFHVTILNTIDQLGKFDRKSDLGFLVGFNLNSNAFRVYNLETKRVKENLHVNFLENKPNVAGKGHAWMFDLDYLNNCTKANDDQGANSEEIDLHEEHFVLPIWSAYSTTVKSSGDKIDKNTDFKTCEKLVSQVEQIFLEELEKLKRQEKEAHDAAKSLRKEATHDIQNANTSITNLLNTISIPLSAASPSRAFNDGELLYLDDPSMPHLEDIYASPSEGIFTDSSYDDEGVVWILVDLPFGKKAIGTKWVYRNKKDERGVVVRNKARLVAQGHRQEEGIDYDEVFALVDRIEAIRIFLAFASYMGFIVYQMDMKSAFLYGTIDEEVYVTPPPGFVDLKFPNKVYKVVKALYGLHQALRDCVKTASTPIETQKPLVKDEEAVDVDVHLYRFQVTPKTSHLQAMKRIFRYLKGQPKLGLWYPKVSSFDLEAYLDSDYAGANLDRKSTTGGCQFLGRRLISWQCKKQILWLLLL
nr:ribonuclease H-like domain-containing protein [Tanacetum cinerariifolium]